jgi:predicted AAA+ superfamily ATPase
MDDLIPRLSERRLTELMRSFRVVVINGPRQAGKTTLLEMYRDHRGGELLSPTTQRSWRPPSMTHGP